MTSPQQPQPQPERGPHDTGAQEQPVPAAPPMPPTAPQAAPPQQQGLPPRTPPAGPEQPGQQPAPQQPAPAREPGTMMLQAQQAPGQPAPAREAGTMMLQAQQAAAPTPLAAHGPGRDAGTMMLQAQAPAQGQGQAPRPPAQPHYQQPHPQQAYPGGAGGYVSPIPVRSTHLGHALASEWTKIRSVRSTLWTLGVMVLLTVGIGLLTGSVIAAHSDSLGPDSLLSYGTFGMMMGLIPLITLGVLVISSEYSTGMVRTTLTACPSRVRILTAKAIVFFALSFVVALVTTTVVALAQYAMLSDLAKSAPTGAEWFKATVGVSLFVAMIGLLSLAVGALLRHSAGAITLVIGVYLLPLVLAIFMRGDSLQDIQTWLLEYALPSQLNVMYSSTLTSSGPSGWDPLWIVTGLTAVTLGSAYAVLNKRDV
ncbi:ABC transporter permease subunit [Streptomyces sp. NPDC054765]